MNSVVLGRISAVLRIMPAALLLLVAMAEPALAQTNTEVLTRSCNILNQIKRWIFTVVYVLGAIGLVLIAISAFLGRFKFSHLISLGGGLFIVASADLLITFVGGSAVECSA